MSDWVDERADILLQELLGDGVNQNTVRRVMRAAEARGRQSGAKEERTTLLRLGVLLMGGLPGDVAKIGARAIMGIIEERAERSDACVGCGAPDCSRLWSQQRKCCPDCSHTGTVPEKHDPVREAATVPLRFVSNGEAGDGQTVCTGCEHECHEPHTWKECAEVLAKWRLSLTDELVEADRENERLDGRRREMRQLLTRLVRYARKDTPRKTRLTKLCGLVTDYLARTAEPGDILRGDDSAKAVDGRDGE